MREARRGGAGGGGAATGLLRHLRELPRAVAKVLLLEEDLVRLEVLELLRVLVQQRERRLRVAVEEGDVVHLELLEADVERVVARAQLAGDHLEEAVVHVQPDHPALGLDRAQLPVVARLADAVGEVAVRARHDVAALVREDAEAEALGAHEELVLRGARRPPHLERRDPAVQRHVVHRLEPFRGDAEDLEVRALRHDQVEVVRRGEVARERVGDVRRLVRGDDVVPAHGGSGARGLDEERKATAAFAPRAISAPARRRKSGPRRARA